MTQKYPSLSPKNTPHYLPKIPLSDPKIPLIIYQKYPSVTQKYLSLSPKNTPQYTRIPQKYPSVSPKITLRYLPNILSVSSSRFLHLPNIFQLNFVQRVSRFSLGLAKHVCFWDAKIHLDTFFFCPKNATKNTPESGAFLDPKIPLSQGYFWKIHLGVFSALPNGEAINTPEAYFSKIPLTQGYFWVQKYPWLRGIFGSKIFRFSGIFLD